jgi:hypothetical protein
MLPRVGFVLALLSASVRPAGADDKRAVPVYTNDDLERVRPFRAETGVTSTPAVVSAPRAPEGPERTRGQGEAYWRREAERLQDRLAPMATQASRIRARMTERRSQPGVRPYSDPQLRAWQVELDRIEARMRSLEERLQERARREGALPGWLR